MKAKLIPSGQTDTCLQFLTNLVLAGYRIIDPAGSDITEEIKNGLEMDTRE